jgi:hypothetical protein
MKSNLFSLILAPVVLVATAVTAIPAMAATTTIKVPFNFTIDGKVCPAGDYTVQLDSPSNLLKLQGKNSSQHFIWLVGPADKGNGGVVLKFDDKSQAHALRSIQYGSVSTGQLDSKTGKAEKLPAGNAEGR